MEANSNELPPKWRTKRYSTFDYLFQTLQIRPGKESQINPTHKNRASHPTKDKKVAKWTKRFAMSMDVIVVAIFSAIMIERSIQCIQK